MSVFTSVEPPVYYQNRNLTANSITQLVQGTQAAFAPVQPAQQPQPAVPSPTFQSEFAVPPNGFNGFHSANVAAPAQSGADDLSCSFASIIGQILKSVKFSEDLK